LAFTSPSSILSNCLNFNGLTIFNFIYIWVTQVVIEVLNPLAWLRLRLLFHNGIASKTSLVRRLLVNTKLITLCVCSLLVSLLPLLCHENSWLCSAFCLFTKYLIVVERLYVNVLYSEVSVRVESNYRLQSIRVNTSYLSHHSYFHILLLVFRNRNIGGWVVLLIWHEDVGH
jgi:hypothetical protein